MISAGSLKIHQDAANGKHLDSHQMGNTMKNKIVNVDSGICGFTCKISSERDNKNFKIEITESDCELIQKYSGSLNDISMMDIFAPLTKNKIFTSAEQAGCHQACPVPSAVVKACEVAAGLALPKNVKISFAEE